MDFTITRLPASHGNFGADVNHPLLSLQSSDLCEPENEKLGGVRGVGVKVAFNVAPDN